MQYEIRIWKDSKKVPDITPKPAAGRLAGMVDNIKSKARILRGQSSSCNPDILIDKNGGGEDVIKSVDISYIPITIENNRGEKKKVFAIKMNIKGNLYLPLKEDGLLEDAASLIGKQKDENKIRDTLLLSQWANVIPEDDETEHFYRGIVVSILTKAGDFRVITAKNVYVESYTENYSEGEFGTFELSLFQSVDANTKFKVAGLGYEEIPLIKSLADKVKKVADGVAKVGTVVAATGAVGMAVTETVEKFTGETAATRWVKYGMGTAATAGGLANSTSNLMKNPKDAKTWNDETKNITKNITDNIKDAKSKSHQQIPLSDLESSYLKEIKADPDRYKEYINMSDAEKRETLNTIKDRSELEEVYLDTLKNDPDRYAKYQQMSDKDKVAELQKVSDELAAAKK